MVNITSDKIEKIKYRKKGYEKLPIIWIHFNSLNKGKSNQSYIFISEEIAENLIKELGVEVFGDY